MITRASFWLTRDLKERALLLLSVLVTWFAFVTSFSFVDSGDVVSLGVEVARAGISCFAGTLAFLLLVSRSRRSWSCLCISLVPLSLAPVGADLCRGQPASLEVLWLSVSFAGALLGTLAGHVIRRLLDGRRAGRGGQF